mmetsp:Transcript_11762/g.25833  ORF Transcript_11762/g.25833 Transcript_11762/m.25833 type:complete len:82 (+) Transcript_11762:513-758(+)
MERSDSAGDDKNFVALEDDGDSEESDCLTWYRLCSGTYSNFVEKVLKYQIVTTLSTEPKRIGGKWQSRLNDIVEIGREAQE